MGLALRKVDVADPRPDIAIGHLGLRVSRFKESLDFFKRVGARVVIHMPAMAILELRGGTHLILRSDKNASTAEAGFDLMVDDITEMRQRLVEGGFAPSDLKRGGIHRSFKVTEPSGILMEFTSSHVTGAV
jgi:hypothetical protein